MPSSKVLRNDVFNAFAGLNPLKAYGPDRYLQPLSIKQPHDPHELDYQHIHFVPWLNSLALQGEAQGRPRTTTTTTTTTTTRL
ncbi:hypothetical protein E2C01_044926 [Portunus trituberculatus]|uniref:Uncharacterized protein n=1 Tax=Portunus trituberculatus TaxID=210409 RepID=A0A5B7G1S9_PORTR|nr:hypothetical protein [Portunus trituberculatus]